MAPKKYKKSKQPKEFATTDVESAIPACSNCQKTPCKSGSVVTSIEQVRTGTVLAFNSEFESDSDWNMKQSGDDIVTVVTLFKYEENDRVTVEQGKGARKFTHPWGYQVMHDGWSKFRFHCKK